MPRQTRPGSLRAEFVSSVVSPPIVLFLQAVLWLLPFPPSHFMTGIVMSLRVLGSLWLGHAVLLSGPEWQWDQVQPPPRTQSHKSSCWHRAPLPEQLPVPAGDKKAFVGFRQPELLLLFEGFWGLWAMLREIVGEREKETHSFFL